MNRTTLIAVACALLVVTTGIAAAVGNAPAPTNADDNANERHDNADERHDRSGNGTAAANDEADERNGGGPNVELPDQVPDHVSAIHDQISSFLDGDLEGPLGDAVSEVTPGDDEPDESNDGDESDEPNDGDESDEPNDGDEPDEPDNNDG